MLDGLDVIALHIDDSHRHIHLLRHRPDGLQLRILAPRHFQMHLINLQIQKCREQWRIPSIAHRMPLKIPKTQMRAQPRPAINTLHRPVKNIDKTRRVLLVSVTTHRRLIDTDFLTSGRHQILQLFPHDRQQRLRDRVAVGIIRIRQKPATQRERPRHTHLQTRPSRRQSLQSLKLLHRTQSLRRC